MTDPVTAYIENLHHPDENERAAAAVALGKAGGVGALDALLTALGREPDVFVREDITWALVRIGPAALDPLIELLSDPDAQVRRHAAHTLGKLGDRRALPALIGALDDSSPVVAAKAAFALSQLGDTEAVPPLIRLLAHSHAEAQTSAVIALEHFGAAAEPALRRALDDPRPQVRALAAEALGII